MPRWQKVAATLIGGYEVAAVWSDLPTISQLCKHRPWLAGILVGGLAVHFHPDQEGR